MRIDEIINVLNDSFSQKREEHIQHIFGRPMIWTDVIMTFMLGAGFITWHHGIVV